MMKKLIIIISGILVCCSLFGQSSDSLRMAGRKAADKPVLSKPVSSKKIKDIRVKAEDTVMMDDTLTNEFLDTLNIRRKTKINDYSLIGVHYGVGLSRMMFNPTQKQDMVFMPYNVGVTYTKYGKMFGYMPYFGFQVGFYYGQEGYQFEYNEERNYTYTHPRHSPHMPTHLLFA